MNILAFAGSNSKNSINKKLVTYVASLFEGHQIQHLDLNDYEVAIVSEDRLEKEGIPTKIKEFAAHIDNADLILLSLAEHNGAYTTAFKNIFDWLSLMKDRTVFQNKPIFLMATSPGARGGVSVIEIAKNRFPFNGGKIIDTFSLPTFQDTFKENEGITNPTLQEELENKVKIILQDLS